MVQPMARIAICDPNEIARLGIAHALEGEGLRVVGVAADCAGAEALLRKRPEVVLIDAATDGLETFIAKARTEGCIVIGTGVEGADERAFAGIMAGACGYLTKDLPARAWAAGVRAALRGEAPLSRALTARLVDAYRTRTNSRLLGLLPSDNRLTTREWEILRLVAQGKTNRSVAQELCISVETVRTHMSNILSKLDAPNRSAAAVKYHQLVGVS
jgi:two-component system, NarL family, response regulator LiaR